MKYEDVDIERSLDCYEPECRVFRSISQQTSPTLREIELALILRWKLNMFKQADKLIVGNLVAINAAITSAGMEGQEIHAIDRLRNIKGIKTAVASAILTVCYPQKFSIIDVRVLRELNLTPTAAGLWSAKMYWEEFIPKVQSFASEHKLSLRDADKVLWGQSVYKDIMARLQ